VDLVVVAAGRQPGQVVAAARAIEHAERALGEARRAGDGATEGKAEYILARESFWSGDLRRSVDHGRRAVALLDRAGERWWLATAHWARALSYLLLGRFDEALDSATWARTIADKMERFVDERVCDGFILVPHVTPGGLERFADEVVPLLQDRGAFREEYEGATLRDHLGLAPLGPGRGGRS